MGKKLTIEFVKESFEKENYTLLDTVYINSGTKLNYICSQGHKHNIIWDSWKQGGRCPSCAGNAKPTFEFVKFSFEKEGYKLLNKEYINNNTKLKYLCPQGHKYSITWSNWQAGHKCPICFRNNYVGENTFLWKGGTRKRNVSLYDTYHPQLSYCEETRKDPNESILLQVKCTKCDKWFTPTLKSVVNRIAALNSNKGEKRFYCSDECKHSCSIFHKVKYSTDEKRSKTNPNFTSEELRIWSKEVLKRANNACEYCNNPATDAHHIQPKKLEPFYALDPDNGVACCESCHYKYGHSGSCSTGTLANFVC